MKNIGSNYKINFIYKNILSKYNNIDCWRELCFYGFLNSSELINKFKKYFEKDIKCWRNLCRSGVINSKEKIDRYIHFFKNNNDCLLYIFKNIKRINYSYNSYLLNVY